MTARRILRRVLLAALLCVLLASAALAADSIDKAIEKLKTAVANGDDSVTVSFLLSESYNKHLDAMQTYILSQEAWVDVSPRLPIIGYGVAGEDNSAIIVRLRYAENHGEYKGALDAAAAACVRSGMTDVEKAASIYSWLADMIVYTEQCDTAYEALVDKRADCFGFAAAFRAIAREAGLECTLVRGKYSSSEHAWNAVKIGKSDDGTGGVWYYVDASRVDGRWIPGHVDYKCLLIGSKTAASYGYSGGTETVSEEAYDFGLDFPRNGVCTPLMVRKDGFWFILGKKLKSAPYGTNFDDRSSTVLVTLIRDSDAPTVVYAAVMVDDVVYYSVNSYGLFIPTRRGCRRRRHGRRG